MLLSDELLQIVPQVPFVPVVTSSANGEPHVILVGKVKEVRDGPKLVFGIYKMKITQENIRDNGKMHIILATREGGSKGFRLTGTAIIEGNEVLFSPDTVESLL